MRVAPLKGSIAAPVLAGIIMAVGYLDYVSAYRLSLFPLYLIPVMIVAWKETKGVTATVTTLAAAIILVKDIFDPLRRNYGIYFYWDEGIKIVLLLIISYAVWEIKELLTEKEKANIELNQALSEIKELRQMIPICAWCHSIRNDRGFYERIEVYLSKLTGAQFTHGICPDCMKKYYSHLTVQEPQESEKGPKKK